MKTPRRYTVLAVDDDEVNLMILTKCVEEAGYAVKPFESGDEAVEYLVNNPTEVDIALLDKMMPGLNGLDMIRRIKSNPATPHDGDHANRRCRRGADARKALKAVSVIT